MYLTKIFVALAVTLTATAQSLNETYPGLKDWAHAYSLGNKDYYLILNYTSPEGRRKTRAFLENPTGTLVQCDGLNQRVTELQSFDPQLENISYVNLIVDHGRLPNVEIAIIHNGFLPNKPPIANDENCRYGFSVDNEGDADCTPIFMRATCELMSR